MKYYSFENIDEGVVIYIPVNVSLEIAKIEANEKLNYNGKNTIVYKGVKEV